MTNSDRDLILQLHQALLDLSARLDAVLAGQKVSDRPWTMADVCEYFDVCPNTVKLWRRQEWQQEIHYWRLPGAKGEYRYNPELLKDWLENRTDPKAHQKAIEVWNSRRLCNQGTSTKRKAK